MRLKEKNKIEFNNKNQLNNYLKQKISLEENYKTGSITKDIYRIKNYKIETLSSKIKNKQIQVIKDVDNLNKQISILYNKIQKEASLDYWYGKLVEKKLQAKVFTPGLTIIDVLLNIVRTIIQFNHFLNRNSKVTYKFKRKIYLVNKIIKNCDNINFLRNIDIFEINGSEVVKKINFSDHLNFYFENNGIEV